MEEVKCCGTCTKCHISPGKTKPWIFYCVSKKMAVNFKAVCLDFEEIQLKVGD